MRDPGKRQYFEPDSENNSICISSVCSSDDETMLLQPTPFGKKYTKIKQQTHDFTRKLSSVLNLGKYDMVKRHHHHRRYSNDSDSNHSEKSDNSLTSIKSCSSSSLVDEKIVDISNHERLQPTSTQTIETLSIHRKKSNNFISKLLQTSMWRTLNI